MLEGAVARILNQLLGKYVVDLDTENLNVGIFSGLVQLTDLKLKTEALYELNLPIQVTAGTIGKIWLQIPWTNLWKQSVVINVEDIHIVCAPVVTFKPFDEENNKRLIRAFKKRALSKLQNDTDIIGGPKTFSEHLVTNIINNLEFSINNVHVRYEDCVSTNSCISAGICIASITAASTNSKWKPLSEKNNTNACYYLVKVDALSCYWNTNSKPSKWNLPSEYYLWRNAMSSSLQNYTIDGENFNFLVKPLSAKLKMTINKSTSIVKLLSDLVVQDCHIQLSQDQYNSILAVCDSLNRMCISWHFLSLRPQEPIMKSKRRWWKYAYEASLEQNVRPYTWSRIKNTRNTYRMYTEIYKQILLNPNDTELKLDLQKYEDNLSVVNVVIARQQARLMVHSSSLAEKSFWAMLPSPERMLLCEKIGFPCDTYDNKQVIEHRYNIRVGNVSVTLLRKELEIAVLTLTQLNFSLKPNFSTGSYRVQAKIEGLVVEGASVEENLAPIISSEHLGNSPAYFFKYELEKLEHPTDFTHKLNVNVSSIEVSYQKFAFDQIMDFMDSQHNVTNSFTNYMKEMPKTIHDFIEKKLVEKWDLNLDFTLPFLVLPENGLIRKGENIMVIDCGRWVMKTELCQGCETIENYTHSELEEKIYSKLHVENSGVQILFCDSHDNWRDAKKEKDTEFHLISKNCFNAVFAVATTQIKSIPKNKYNINIESIKVNLSERKLGFLLRFLHNLEKLDIPEMVIKKVQPSWMLHTVREKYNTSYLTRVQSSVTIPSAHMKSKRNKHEKCDLRDNAKKNPSRSRKENMNEVWARTVDLPGLEDNISPSNNILNLICVTLLEFTLVFSRSSDSTDRQYLMLRMGKFAMDLAFMTFGPAYQLSLNNILLTDKLHTTASGQYLDLLHSPFPSTLDVLSILYRKVDASCPEFWSHFHGVETSLVADIGTLHLLLHQEAIHTFAKYFCYINNKIKNQVSANTAKKVIDGIKMVQKVLHVAKVETPVPAGAVKFSHSARLGEMNVKICDADYDILNIYVSGFELDVLFRANERFVFRSFLSSLNVEHLSDVTLYPRVLYTDKDKVYEIKYVRMSNSNKSPSDITSEQDKLIPDGTFKFHLGQIHLTFLYKLFVQLQRFIINIEAIIFIQSCFRCLKTTTSKISNLLRSPTKMQTSINICGPIFLFPQKSSSPNVIIFDTGEVIAENFFKQYSTETVENIMIKLDNMTVSRGIMTLTNSLEMQEVIVEPFNMCLDAKRFIYVKPVNKTLSWDLNAVLDTIHVTLGQRDVCIMCCILKDNMGEGDIIDLFPEQEETPPSVAEDTDKSMKALETFFCEPKQKSVISKLLLDGVKLSLYFDSGEVLSSPVRDLNHGLCKFELADICTTFTVYSDKSLDGKLSIDNVLVEEIGPNANVLEKQILVAPSEMSSSVDCNITVNKPPIVDITFHQNKSEDKTADVIIGKLSLTLSVPFCEKITMFILECIPKDNVDSGIVNLGYVKDAPTNDNNPLLTSITVSLRVNKPEFIFLIETASNKKRFFITKCEILSDYSLHNNRLNFIMSLSGLHTVFCDFGVNSNEPYIVLKHCDVELSKCFSEEKGNKMSLSISSVYVQICNRVVHSITDILNDVAEHFKVPEVQQSFTNKSKNKSSIDVPEMEDLWEPKRLIECVPKCNEDYVEKESVNPVVHEIFLVPKLEIVLILELQEIQILCFKATAEVTIYDWSSLLNCTCELTLQASYYNESVQAWEPFIDPVIVDESEYKPWDVLIKIFQDKSLPILQITDRKAKKENSKNRKGSHSSTATEEDDSAEDMIYLEPANLYSSRNSHRVKTNLSAFLDDSDSENEDFTMEKLATAISDLFTGDWNESEDSETENSSDSNDESESNVVKNNKNTCVYNQSKKFEKATYIIIDAKEKLDVTITPNLLKIFTELCTEYSSKTLSISGNRKMIKLVNDIGPNSRIELYENCGDAEQKTLICLKTYENQDSYPNSPSKQIYSLGGLSDDMNEDCFMEEMSKIEIEHEYNFEAISSLQFPVVTTAQVFEKVNKYCLKVHMDGFSSFQTNCSNRNWEKLIKIQSKNSGQFYHLAARHSIGKDGRNIVISSPLQIQNKTCFALSILYQPSVLQQLNLEPVGDVTNPFETTMRIAVLEPHEQYNVPLYIAYHCKLFIQPAYAEGHYVSHCGIWWQDLLTELDSTHNFHCTPKQDSNVEIFSLRIKLQQNIVQKNSHAHSIPNYIIHILPPLVLYNFLPYTLEVENTCLKQQIKVDPGEKNSVYSLDLTKEIKLMIKMKYSGMVWSGNFHYTPQFEEKIVTLSTEEKGGKQVLVNVRVERENSCKIFFYSSYWIINKTGLPLHIKTSINNFVYENTEETIILFSFKRHGKQTLNAKVYDSDWSSEFSLDCAGTPGLVVCKHHERKKRYTMLLLVKLSEMCPKFTKIVTFLPCFLIANDTSHFLRVMEHNEKTDLWIDLPSKSSITFWPETNSMQMYVKYRDSKSHSQPFFCNTIHRTVLRMDKGAAVCVDVSGGKMSPFEIVFQEYKPGDAPVLIKNYCTDLFLKIQQQGQGQVTLVNPYNSLLYTWDDPLKPRMLVWNIYNNKGSGFLVDILKDGYGEEKISLRSVNTTETNNSSSEESDSSDSVKTTLNKKVHRDKIIIYWLCFRDGLQRALVFTQEQRIANYIIKTMFLEYCNTEWFVSIAGMGLSVFIDSSNEKEHIYYSISDSPAIWEVNIGHKWKILTLELASWIEDKYRLHYKKCQLKDYVHTDFEKMFMLKPFFAELRRTYTPGAYIQFRKSRNYEFLNFKLQSLQVDNKQLNSSSSIMLYPLPAENIRAQNPFLELSVFRSCFKNCTVYKLIKLNVSDFFLSIEDQLFLDLNNLFLNNCKLIPERSTLYRNDMAYLHKSVTKDSVKDISAGTSLVENLQVSQISVQLNICKTTSHFSLDSINLKNFKFLDHMFPMNISPYIQIGTVLLKSKPLELVEFRENMESVLFRLWDHISLQFLQIYYSQVLGFQVLINPYAADVAASLENIVWEVEKCASTTYFGCRCVLGHINMSPAALEQCITDIFTNQNIENIQRIRRHGSYQKSGTVPKCITASSKDFKTGVPLALEQLIAKGVNGAAYCNGELFFRGVGKALLSLITRQPDDKSNSVQVATEALRRASILGEPVRVHQRLTRYSNKYFGLKPYSTYESMGHHLLHNIANSRYCNDTYWAHSAVDKSGNSLIIVSLEHVIRINKTTVWGAWDIEWCLELDDIVSIPKISTKELVFNVRQNPGSFVLATGNLTISGDKEMLNWLQGKLEQAIILSMEEKSWPID